MPAAYGGCTHHRPGPAPSHRPPARTRNIRPLRPPAAGSARRATARESGSAAYGRRAYHLRLEAGMRSGTAVGIGSALVALAAVGFAWTRAAAQPQAPAAD